MTLLDVGLIGLLRLLRIVRERAKVERERVSEAIIIIKVEGNDRREFVEGEMSSGRFWIHCEHTVYRLEVEGVRKRYQRFLALTKIGKMKQVWGYQESSYRRVKFEMFVRHSTKDTE